MELLRDVLLDSCSEELEELGDYTVSMYKDSGDFPQMIEDTYSVPSELILDGLVIDDTGDGFFELVVLQMTGQASASEAMNTFMYYDFGLLVDSALPEENKASYEYVMDHITTGRVNEYPGMLSCQDQYSVQSTLNAAIDYKLLPDGPDPSYMGL